MTIQDLYFMHLSDIDRGLGYGCRYLVAKVLNNRKSRVENIMKNGNANQRTQPTLFKQQRNATKQTHADSQEMSVIPCPKSKLPN